MNIFGKRLEQIRTKKGWTKTYTAKLLKIPLTTYANYEYGNREPDINTISAISRLFNTTNDYLMGTSDNPIKDMSDSQSIPLEDDMPLSYHGYNIPDKYLDMVKGLMEADIKDGKADKDEQPK